MTLLIHPHCKSLLHLYKINGRCDVSYPTAANICIPSAFIHNYTSKTAPYNTTLIYAWFCMCVFLFFRPWIQKGFSVDFL